MCIYLYDSICMCIHTCMRVHICIYIYIYTHTCMYMCIPVCVHLVYVCMYMSFYVCVYIHTHVYILKNRYMCMCICVCIHICANTFPDSRGMLVRGAPGNFGPCCSPPRQPEEIEVQGHWAWDTTWEYVGPRHRCRWMCAPVREDVCTYICI